MLSMDKSISIPCLEDVGLQEQVPQHRNPQSSPAWMNPALWSCGYIIPCQDHGGTMFSMCIYHCALNVYFVMREGYHA